MIGKLHRFWFREIDPFILGVFRICLGLCTVLLYLNLAPVWLKYYGPEGVFPLGAASDDPRINVSLLALGTSNALLWTFWASGLVAAVLLTLGIGGRFSLLWVFLMNLSIYNRNPLGAESEHRVLGFLYLYSLFLPLTKVLTLPQLIRNPAGFLRLHEGEKVTVWALTLLQVHCLAVYLCSVPLKLATDPAWWNGLQTYYGMMHLKVSRWPGLSLFSWGDAWISRVLTWYSLVVEGLFPFLVWFKRFRTLFVWLAILLQLGISFFMVEASLFSLAMAVGLVSFFPSRRARRFFQRRLRCAE